MRSDKIFAFTDEEKQELKELLQAAIDEHGENVKDLTNDDSTKAEEFRVAIADEFHRHALRIRLLAMLKGGE